jgi:hypothetical protein
MFQTAFHSQIAETLNNSNKLWYYCRAMDPKGSGYADVHTYTAQKELNISHTTFYRYLKDQRIINNIVKLSNHTVRIFYRAILKVCKQNYIADLGAVTWTTIDELKDWRKISALIEALQLQAQSIYAATRDERELKGKNNRRSIIKTDAIFIKIDELKILQDELNISSKISCKIGNTKKSWAMLQNNRLFIDADSVLPYGGSHYTLAKRINKSERTIRRRLKSVDKVRQATGKKEFDSILSQLLFFDSEDGTSLRDHYFKFNSLYLKVNIFKHYCNIYKEVYDLSSCKMKRTLINKYFKPEGIKLA